MSEGTSIQKYTLTQLHSLAGVLGLGCLWVAHLAAGAWLLSGPAAFDAQLAESLASWPHRALAMATHGVLIGIPVAFYVVYGVLRLRDGGDTVRTYPSFRNWAYSAQRYSFLGLLLFIPYHLWNTWALIYLQWGGAGMGPHPAFEGRVVSFGHHVVWLIGSSYASKLLYATACFVLALNLSLALWSLLVNWGAVSGRAAMQRLTVFCALVFAALFSVGIQVVAEAGRWAQALAG